MTSRAIRPLVITIPDDVTFDDLDLAYDEDSNADVDMNVIRTGDGRFIEVQGTAEREPFPRAVLDQLLDLGSKGIDQLIAKQAVIVCGLLKVKVPARA